MTHREPLRTKVDRYRVQAEALRAKAIADLWTTLRGRVTRLGARPAGA